jgi:membrane-associated phospholipid phosphatase
MSCPFANMEKEMSSSNSSLIQRLSDEQDYMKSLYDKKSSPIISESEKEFSDIFYTPEKMSKSDFDYYEDIFNSGTSEPSKTESSEICPCSGERNIKNNDWFNKLVEFFKKMAGEKDLYKAISLYEFYMNIAFIILILSTRNTYLAILFLGLFSKQIPERLIKRFLSYETKDGQKSLTKWASRPAGANNCNMLNSGGSASEHSGLISGHTFLISTLAFYTIYKFTDNLKHNVNSKQGIFITLLFLWMSLVAMARIRLGCHQPHQTVLGFVGGIVWGYVIYIVIEKIINNSSRVKEDEEKIMKLFE